MKRNSPSYLGGPSPMEYARALASSIIDGIFPAHSPKSESSVLLRSPGFQVACSRNRSSSKLIDCFSITTILICGPVFPHEVVGFSGGNKYLFPGVSTGEMIHQTHWLGALLGSYNIIGTGTTPVRQLIDLAAAKVSVPVACFALVLKGVDIAGIHFGPAREAWKLAAEQSSQTH